MKRKTLPFFWLTIAWIILAISTCCPDDIAVELEFSKVPEIKVSRRHNSSRKQPEC